jgi:ABC-type Fe3+/spermidine/putrescine transport system ATPase subunit
VTPGIRVVDLVKRFGAVTAVDGVSFEVGKGEFLSLLGPSGCGKTTTLRCIGGYERPTSGTLEIAGRVVNDVPVHRRDIGMVFQSYALFPHKTVGDNVGFALKMRGVSRADRRRQVAEALELVELPGYEDRYPRQLSAGQRQRVALARAVIHRPSVLLLDEPLANLDRKLRQTMRVELKLIQEKVGISTIFVTHDQEEALVMSDRIAVMEGGRIHQIGPPSEVYHRPATGFVAKFIGETNYLDGHVTSIDGALARVRVSGDTDLLVEAVDGASVGRAVAVSVRPERIDIGRVAPAGADNVVVGTVEFVTYLGSTASYRVHIGGDQRFHVTQPLAAARAPYSEGDTVALWWPPDRGLLIV